MTIYVCPSNYALHVQMKFPKHVLVQTRDINKELYSLQIMSCYIFHVWGHIRNDILCGGKMRMVRTYRECRIHALYLIKGVSINEREN